MMPGVVCPVKLLDALGSDKGGVEQSGQAGASG
eukprot:CAMPEP_0174328934 /NCGR_PEP_ID=MMETSP0810-20121108/15485_1 /TAXON_ID=73025 ORGANISM="Eutreptiella gymnastica-like, Strain CCMP1594" /NCGR_SAMPLE_ID=MMETSP0810 /ASSEMBLY_ACC=CAM_ASM_000659 /LENGTH=32 /DNA_ID= /DNA_START= /DNA_END= /DNA_ORIENTATION=